MSRATVTQRTQIGAETTLGTLVPAGKRLPNLKIMPYPVVETKSFMGQGFKYPSAQAFSKEWTAFTYDGGASYGELPYIFASLFSATTPVAVGSGGQQWSFAHSFSNPDVPQSYSMEHGDNGIGERFPYALFDAMTLNITRDEFKVSGTGFGQQWAKGISLTTVNAQQTVTISGTPTGGTFTLTFNGATTAPIAYNASAAVVAAALALLPTIGNSANVGASGGTLPGTPVVVTFQGALGGEAIPLMTASGASLTGGSSPTVTVTQTTAGSPLIVENIPIVPNQISVYLDTTFAGIGTTLLTANYVLTLALTGRWGPTWPINGALGSHGGHVELVPKASLKLEIQADTVNDTFIDQVRASGVKYLQIKGAGPTIGGGANYGFTLNVPFALDKANPMKDLAGIYVADWDLMPIADPVANYAVNAVVTNKTSAL